MTKLRDFIATYSQYRREHSMLYAARIAYGRS